jgi:protein-disulfide isomerase
LVLEEVLKEYEGKVRVVLKHMIVHPNVASAHLAACGAAKQGKFKEFYKGWWDRAWNQYTQKRDPALISEEAAHRIAAEVGVNVDQMKSDQPACEQMLQADMAELRKFKVGATPTFFVNGEQMMLQRLDKSEFKRYIDPKLKIAQASGIPGSEYYEKEIRAKGEKQVGRPGRQQQQQ